MIPLDIRVLGPLEVARGARRCELPRSRKTRALLAYLALAPRDHAREQLCGLLWPGVADPRGALRWSLSRLRAVVAEAGHAALVATPESVRLDARDVRVDAPAGRASSHPRWVSETKVPCRGGRYPALIRGRVTRPDGPRPIQSWIRHHRPLHQTGSSR